MEGPDLKNNVIELRDCAEEVGKQTSLCLFIVTVVGMTELLLSSLFVFVFNFQPDGSNQTGKMRIKKLKDSANSYFCLNVSPDLVVTVVNCEDEA
eukprot:Awhi_evm1s15182